MINLEIKGLKEMDDALKRFSLNLRKKALRQSARAGAKILLKEVRDRVPVDSRNLKKEYGR